MQEVDQLLLCQQCPQHVGGVGDCDNHGPGKAVFPSGKQLLVHEEQLVMSTNQRGHDHELDDCNVEQAADKHAQAYPPTHSRDECECTEQHDPCRHVFTDAQCDRRSDECTAIATCIKQPQCGPER